MGVKLLSLGILRGGDVLLTFDQVGRRCFVSGATLSMTGSQFTMDSDFRRPHRPTAERCWRQDTYRKHERQLREFPLREYPHLQLGSTWYGYLS